MVQPRDARSFTALCKHVAGQSGAAPRTCAWLSPAQARAPASSSHSSTPKE
jgi:hypothetical protein